jgi:hypothetical protein
MKKISLLLFLLLTITMVSSAGENKSKPVLRFSEHGTFKIVQFTDIHFQYNSYRSDSALMMIKRAVEEEKPDLVVLTGDVVCSKDTRRAWLTLAQPFIEAKVPWAVTLGNHDIEYELTGEQIMETITDLPYSLTASGPDDVSGSGNYMLKIRSSKSPETEALLYFFDSHSGFHPKGELGSYDWIKFDQVQWYRNESKKMTRENGGVPYPALAFFHIPLIEYNEVWGKETTVGVKEETVCSPDINSGMYNAFLESKDVMGMFTGHDHNNNYIGCLRNICLAYGNVSGRQCYGKIGRGYRVIELVENERKFTTWIRTRYNCDRDLDIWEPALSDEPEYVVTYPDSFAETGN